MRERKVNSGDGGGRCAGDALTPLWPRRCLRARSATGHYRRTQIAEGRQSQPEVGQLVGSGRSGQSISRAPSTAACNTKRWSGRDRLYPVSSRTRASR
jgi:hypothetical protein